MKKNSPQIRFEGFEGEWEKTTLGNISKVCMNKRIFKSETLTEGEIPFYKIGTFGGKPDAFISRQLFEEYREKYDYPDKGDILLSASGSIGRTVIYGGEEEYFQDSNIIWLKPSSQLLNTFLYQFYSIVKWDGLEGSTIKRLYNKNILSTNIFLPSVQEQQAIGSFFKELDDIISLKKRELELLKEQKKGFLQKMFPKNGAKVPELRFAGFADDWEERKLGDFIDVKSGKDYKHLNSGSIPVYGTGGYMLSVDRALSDIDAIGIGRKGTIDKPYLLKAPFWTVDTLFYAVPKQNIDLQFSLSIFKKINWKKFDESTGVPSLSKTVINSVGASVPSYEEQQKIGTFFKQLDDTIALHQRKLDLLKETKKGFLQKMFV